MKIKLKSIKESTTVSGGNLGDTSLPQKNLFAKPVKMKLVSKTKPQVTHASNAKPTKASIGFDS